MEFTKPDKRAVALWRASRIIIFAVFFLLFAVAFSLYHFAEIAFMLYVSWAFGAFCAWHLMGIFIFPAIEYRQWQYAITPEKVHIEHGIFFLKASIIPIVRIQHLTISRGPLSRRFGLVTLKVHTASGSFDIMGLSEETAADLSKKLNDRLQIRLEAREDA